MDISSILKKKRRDHKLTQEQLAEKIFVSTKIFSNWENNKTTPDIDSLIILAQLFDLSLDNLLLKGSNIVENIKKQSDIRSTKIYLNFATITDLACLFILVTQPIFGNLSLPALIILNLAIISNCAIIIYFGNRLIRLTKNFELANMPREVFRKAILTGVIWGSIIGIVIGIIILFFLYKYLYSYKF